MPGQPRGRLCPRGGCAGRARRPGGRQGLRAARCPQEGEALHGQQRVVLRAYGPMPFPALETRYQLLSPRVRARANALGKQLTGSLAVPCGRRRQRNGLVYHAGYEGFDPESWQVIVKAHESVRLELAPPVHGALQTVVLILRSPTTCYKELIATTSTTLARPRDRGARIRGSCARTMARVGWDNPIVRCVCVHDQ